MLVSLKDMVEHWPCHQIQSSLSKTRSEEIYHGQCRQLESIICQCLSDASKRSDHTYLEACSLCSKGNLPRQIIYFSKWNWLNKAYLIAPLFIYFLYLEMSCRGSFSSINSYLLFCLNFCLNYFHNYMGKWSKYTMVKEYIHGIVTKLDYSEEFSVEN